MILKETPFYAESGGQVGDTGFLSAGDSFRADVLDTKKPVDGLIVHKVRVVKGELKNGMAVSAHVDVERRQSIMRHHTATHLLHKALRQILGTHVTQAGSLVTPDSLRFDFTHFHALSLQERRAVEEIVNAAVRKNFFVSITQESIETARAAGAMALFGEKYGSKVRMVAVKAKEGEHTETPFSLELCGGTHVEMSGDIGFFKILSETSIASGTRRIEGVCGAAAEKYIQKLENAVSDASAALKTNPDDLIDRIEKLIALQKESEKEIRHLKAKLATGGTGSGAGTTDDFQKDIQNIKGINVLLKRVSGLDVGSMREAADALRQKLKSGIVILINTEDDKVSFIVSLTTDAQKAGFNAGKIAKGFAGLIGGSGGGRPDFAQGGGKDPAVIDTALAKIPELIQ